MLNECEQLWASIAAQALDARLTNHVVAPSVNPALGLLAFCTPVTLPLHPMETNLLFIELNWLGNLLLLLAAPVSVPWKWLAFDILSSGNGFPLPLQLQKGLFYTSIICIQDAVRRSIMQGQKWWGAYTGNDLLPGYYGHTGSTSLMCVCI